ncbi:unnamed protein product, partial [Mesorhabditis belari]|uniref:Uncharacterized protein n=1 Tax=Mesorhabditis belari TaxID=2138241 RepID=A0AAF3J7X8_9BILA
MTALYCRIPSNYGLPAMVAEEVLRCPKCSDRLIPQLLDINEQGEQNVWWVCAAMNENPKSCNFPLAMPPDVFWVKRTARDIRMNIIPRPKITKLPKKFHYLYPGLFSSRESSRSSHSSSLRSKKRKALTRSDGISAGSSDSGHRPLTPMISSERSIFLVTQEEVTPVANVSLDNSAFMIDKMTEPLSTSFATVSESPQRCVSPGIGELFATPPQSSKKGVVEIVDQANVSTTGNRIAQDAKKLEKRLHKPLNTLQQRNVSRRQAKGLTLAPAPMILKATTPFEKTKAALTLMHSAPTEIPESFIQASRKLAVAGGYKQRISQWNRNSAVDHLRSEHRSKPQKLIKRPRGDADYMVRNNADEMELPKPENENMQHIEMEVRHRLTAKMLQYGYGGGKAADEMNYLMGHEYGEQSMASQTSELSNSQEQQVVSMQPVKNEEAMEQIEHENWFNEVDNLDLSVYGEQSNSNRWSTLTQASTSTTEVFSGAFEDSITDDDQFDDLYPWNHHG